ncbi:prolactin-releasing peptide-like isoform X1 [Pogoniulus pusillus]|uniref:prolactin-releasing peptide-like isoform X1 n=2 Tax=Pogoniulus pusillus TaxID=488313 RepID=UPI0030B96704
MASQRLTDRREHLHACRPRKLSHHCSIMWHPVWWTPCAPWSPKHLKLVTVSILALLVLLSFASGQSRPFKHQIDNRSPEIDPFWYVGRGVRPIGRFGKRQLSSSRGSLRPRSRHLDFTLNALWQQQVSDTEDW